MTEDYKSSVAETFPFPLELGSVSPEKLEDLEFDNRLACSVLGEMLRVKFPPSPSPTTTEKKPYSHRLLAGWTPAQSHIPYELRTFR